MKIILSGRRFVPPLTGGVDVYADRLARALRRLRHEVAILAFDPSAETDDSAITVSPEQYDGIQLWRVHFSLAKRPAEAFDLAYDAEMGRVIRSILQEQQPALFVIMNFYTVTLAAVEAAKSLGIPVVHIATDFVPVCRRATFIRWNGQPCQAGESIKSCSECFVGHRLLGRVAATTLSHLPEETLVRWAGDNGTPRPPHPFWLLKPYWRQIRLMDRRLRTIGPLRQQIDVVLAPSRFIGKTFIANGFKPEQVHYLPYGVEPEHPLANVKHEPSDHIRFLFVGRLQPYKGAHLLIEAFNNLSAPRNAALTVYGPADGYPDYYESLVTMAAANDRVRLAGQIAPHELIHAFAQADYFVLPSTWHENTPLVLLEALQSRTPAIASAIGGATDLIKDGVNGLLFPMGDQQALQQVLQRVINQPALVEQFRSGIDLLGIDDYANTLLKLCRHLV